MKPLRNWMQARITAEHVDVRLSTWACYLGGLGLFVVAVLSLHPDPGGRGRWMLGLGAALVTFQLMVLFGTLAQQVHLASVRGAIRSRGGEYSAYGVGLAILLVGMWQLARLGLERADMILGLLLILAACMATLSLGVATTLVRSHRI